jgi:hypothetical protein
MKTEPDTAICGNCGKSFADHYHEDEDYCFENTTGDIFTEEPSDGILVSFIENEHPNIHAQMVSEWKQENGHSAEKGARDE